MKSEGKGITAPGIRSSHASGEVLANDSTMPDTLSAFPGYLRQLGNVREQLKQTSCQIEQAVVDVCESFQGIAIRASATVARATGFLAHDGPPQSGKPSFECLLEALGGTQVNIMNVTAEAADVSRRAIDRIEEMDKGTHQISEALAQLDAIANGNRMLAFNARIEAAHAGTAGRGFAVVAVELAAQTVKSQMVTAHVGELAMNLRALAESTLKDLRDMNEKDAQRIEHCRRQVDASLGDLQAAHREMAEMLSGMTSEGALLANDINAVVRGMQFQDRIGQRIGHVVADLDTLSTHLAGHMDGVPPGLTALGGGFTVYTMKEERDAAGLNEVEASAGDVELF